MMKVMAYRIEHSASGNQQVTARADPQPVILLETKRSPNLLGLLIRLLGAAVLLLLVTLLTILVVIITNLAGIGRVGDDLGGRARNAVDSAGATLQRSAQRVTDRFDPAHLPREPLAYDAEFSQLATTTVGSDIVQGSSHVLTLVEIRSRSDTSDPNETNFAVVESRLVTPRETTVLGVTVLRDEERRTDYLYKAESFRVGDAYYKVNWIAAAPPEIAVARYRYADSNVALKIALD